MTTQLDVSVGLAKESVYGTFVPPTSFIEPTSESLDLNLTVVNGTGLRPGRRTTTTRQRAIEKRTVTGDTEVEADYDELGILLAAAFGSVTSTLAKTGGATYQHLFAPFADYLPSYSIQKGIPPLGGGAAVPFSFLGMQANQLEFAAKNGAVPTAKVTWVGKDMQSIEPGAPAFVQPTYPTTSELLSFVGGSITVGGTVAAPTATALAAGGTEVATVTDATVTLNNSLDSGGYTLGAGGTRSRPGAALLAKLSGSLTAEFRDTTFWQQYLGQVQLGLLLNFVGSATPDTGLTRALQLYIPAIALDGDTPKAKAGSIVTQSVNFTGLQDMTKGLPMIQAVLRNTITHY